MYSLKPWDPELDDSTPINNGCHRGHSLATPNHIQDDNERAGIWSVPDTVITFEEWLYMMYTCSAPNAT
jgi:hypothetical protein